MSPLANLAGALPPLRPGLRVPRHRATTRNLVALYPWVAEAGLGGAGVQMGLNVTAGNDAFHFDPFQLYTDDHLQGPNMVVCGMVGCGKSASLKAFLWRSVGMFGSPPAGGEPNMPTDRHRKALSVADLPQPTIPHTTMFGPWRWSSV